MDSRNIKNPHQIGVRDQSEQSGTYFKNEAMITNGNLTNITFDLFSLITKYSDKICLAGCERRISYYFIG